MYIVPRTLQVVNTAVFMSYLYTNASQKLKGTVQICSFFVTDMFSCLPLFLQRLRRCKNIQNATCFLNVCPRIEPPTPACNFFLRRVNFSRNPSHLRKKNLHKWMWQMLFAGLSFHQNQRWTHVVTKKSTKQVSFKTLGTDARKPDSNQDLDT